MHEERIKESPLMKEYDGSNLLDFKRRKLVLQVDKWDQVADQLTRATEGLEEGTKAYKDAVVQKLEEIGKRAQTPGDW